MTTPAPQQSISSPTTNPTDQTVSSAAAVRPVCSSNGLGTAGFVLGTMGAVFCWVPLLGFALGALAVVFGGLGIAAASRGEATNRTVAAWGLALGIFALVFWPLFVIWSGRTPGRCGPDSPASSRVDTTAHRGHISKQGSRGRPTEWLIPADWASAGPGCRPTRTQHRIAAAGELLKLFFYGLRRDHDLNCLTYPVSSAPPSWRDRPWRGQRKVAV
jgi:hypothetical protein